MSTALHQLEERLSLNFVHYQKQKIVYTTLESTLDSTLPTDLAYLLDQYRCGSLQISVAHLPADSYQHQALHHPFCSGVHIQALLMLSNVTERRVYDFLASLRGLVLAPLASLRQVRLHRHVRIVPNDNETFVEVVLPWEGDAAFSAEAMRAWLPSTGLFSLLGGPRAASDRLLGVIQPNSVPILGLQRYLFTNITHACDDCPVEVSKRLRLPLHPPPRLQRIGDIFPDSNLVVNSLVERTEMLINGQMLETNATDLLAIKVAPSYETLSMDPLYEVNYHVKRNPGILYQGSVGVELVNRNVCAARVRVEQHILPILQPRWKSFQVLQQDSLENDLMSATPLSWTNLSKATVFFEPEGGAISFSFAHTLPSQSSLRVSFDFDPVLVNIEHFPGDAVRGFEMPPIHASFVCIDGADDADLYSEALLLMAPVPDMSMPFNVLSLSCTLYVFVVGTILNLAIRRASDSIREQLDPDSKPKSKLGILREKVRGLLHHRSTNDGTSQAETGVKIVERVDDKEKSE